MATKKVSRVTRENDLGISLKLKGYPVISYKKREFYTEI